MYGDSAGATTADLDAVLDVDIDIDWQLVSIEDQFGEVALDELVIRMAEGRGPRGVIHDFWEGVHEIAAAEPPPHLEDSLRSAA